MGCHFCSAGNERDLPHRLLPAPADQPWRGGWKPVCSTCQAEHAELLERAAEDFFFGGM